MKARSENHVNSVNNWIDLLRKAGTIIEQEVMMEKEEELQEQVRKKRRSTDHSENYKAM